MVLADDMTLTRLMKRQVEADLEDFMIARIRIRQF